jgi:hypothetical protein
LFAWITSSKWASVKVDVVAQGVILALVGVIQWYGLATPLTREASDLPYRHVFGFWAPCIVAIVALAPWIARRIFEGNSPVPTAARQRFQNLLEHTELFVNPTEPELTCRGIAYAIVYGPVYNPLHLLLIPSLVALVAPAKWLYLDGFLAFVISFLLLVWGNLSSRWQQLNISIERGFLRGTPFFISLCVIVVAILRFVQFDYVSTILDAAPFGVAFGLVIMSYVLFWLVEYWMSRVAAVSLLSVLGPPADEVRVPGVCVPYSPDIAANQHDPQIQVEKRNRFLVSHGTGRFVVVGTKGDFDPTVAPPVDLPVRAFETYYLMDLFSRLGDSMRNLQDHEHDPNVADINQRTGTHFFRLNFLVFLVTAGFGGFYFWEQWANNAIDPVVTVEPAPPPEQLVDLSSLLQQTAEPARPAIVVVGSGGGTRAALYTASVLNGLHRLGVDRDIRPLA